MNRDRKPVTPAFSMTRPNPDQRQREPAMDIPRVIPACAPWGMEAARESRVPVSKAKPQETKSRPHQIQLITMSITSVDDIR